jgi:hypothetical protein
MRVWCSEGKGSRGTGPDRLVRVRGLAATKCLECAPVQCQRDQAIPRSTEEAPEWCLSSTDLSFSPPGKCGVKGGVRKIGGLAEHSRQRYPTRYA